jgi:hypothetical protein
MPGAVIQPTSLKVMKTAGLVVKKELHPEAALGSKMRIIPDNQNIKGEYQ